MKKATATRAGNSSQRCLDAAFRYLDYRPRSEAELRGRLKRRGFDEESVAATLSSLREQGLVDDLAFAEFWKDNRESFRPRSRRLTALELRQKGVAEEVINRVVADIDDEDSAYRAAQGRAHRLSDADYREFRHRLGEYLKRRGFGYRVITRTVERLWQERKGGEKWE
jgi:regulatory protein